MAQEYKPGEIVPQSGIYTITHDPAHADMPHQVTVIKGRRFPTCRHCEGHHLRARARGEACRRDRSSRRGACAGRISTPCFRHGAAGSASAGLRCCRSAGMGPAAVDRPRARRCCAGMTPRVGDLVMILDFKFRQTLWRRRQSEANPSLVLKFPASWENTGNFIDFWLGRPNLPPK